ncbi:MAG: hypothetical protein ACYS0I_11200 [Planctomycetota bacterium]|jgi:hypothetical protein
MSVKEKAKHILVELKGHAPFTLLGALLGIFFMLLFRNLSGASGYTLFSIFHPAHVVLSAMVTASMFKIHAIKKQFILVLLVGYFGSVGIATLSDVVIPHAGTHLLGLNIPAHAELHNPTSAYNNEADHRENTIHIGFIEQWYIVNPAALLGVIIAYFLPRTKFPHTGHVLISTWASSSYLLMNIQSEITIAAAIGIFATLFIAIWLPCCISDIIFPLLFVKSDLEQVEPCLVHGRHSHPHLHKQSENHQ